MSFKQRLQIAWLVGLALGSASMREGSASSISNSTPRPPPNQYSNIVVQPPGTLLVGSNLTFTFSLPPPPRSALTFTRSNVLIMPGGRLRIYCDGTAATNYYQLTATHEAYFGGSLEFLQTNGFTAQLGQTFEPLRFTNRMGEFTNITVSPLDGDLGWKASYESNALRLSVVAKTNPPSLALVPDTNAATARVSLSGVIGESYIVEATSNLVDWTPVLTNSPFRGWFELGGELIEPGALLLRAIRVAP